MQAECIWFLGKAIWLKKCVYEKRNENDMCFIFVMFWLLVRVVLSDFLLGNIGIQTVICLRVQRTRFTHRRNECDMIWYDMIWFDNGYDRIYDTTCDVMRFILY